MVTAPVMPMARGIQAAFTRDAPLLVNASSASDVRLAAMYQRKWCGDMQAPPLARIEKAQETIASSVGPSRQKIPVPLLANEAIAETGSAGGLGSASHTAIRPGAAAIAAGEKNTTCGNKTMCRV